MNDPKPQSPPPPAASAAPAAARFDGHPALRAWLEAECARYAPDVRWTAPRRGVSLTGCAAVVTHLAREVAAMERPQLSELRRTSGRAQSFHEFTIRFRLVAPGIPGVNLPLGADVELERLRVLTCDAEGRVAVESCIETWTWLSAQADEAPPER